MELKDTIKLMKSDDYKERFKAEFYQTKIRYDKLRTIILKMQAGTLNFEPKCPLGMFKEQFDYMGCYLHILEQRAKIEGIKL